MIYLIVLEKGRSNFSAYCPDIPVCMRHRKDPRRQHQEIDLREGLPFHIEFIAEKGEPVPPPSSIGRRRARRSLSPS